MNTIEQFEKIIRTNQEVKLKNYTLWVDDNNMILYSDNNHNHAEAPTLNELILIVRDIYNVTITIK